MLRIEAERLLMKRGGPCAAIALIALSAFLLAPIAATATTDPGPLVISRQGVFFVGGHYVKQTEGTVMDGQMYVQFQIPARLRHRYPIVMIHGYGQSGVNFLSTPDGREGWAELFLRRGYAIYVVDQVFRGRSVYHPMLDGAQRPFPVELVESLFTDPQDHSKEPIAKLHDQWPGTGKRGDPAFDQFYASQLESTSDADSKIDEESRDARIALLIK